jgi:hypothetical protein
MNPRWVAMAALGREAAVPALVLAWLAAYGSAGIENTRAAPMVYRTQSLAADASVADKPQPIAIAAASADIAAGSTGITVASTDIAVTPADIKIASEITSKPVTEAVTPDDAPTSRESEPVVTAALTDSSEIAPPEASPKQPEALPELDTKPGMALQTPAGVDRSVDSVAVLDECPVVENCIDRYLWALYQRTPKEDAVKTEERTRVTVKKKGKLVTVTRSVTRVADEDFSWKDPKAADNAGMPIADYVIGGVDRDFKLKLFHLLNAAQQAGLSPGITSAFRDDYRQSIASGLKAANDRSYHGGSFRGGYGHGLAADVVSTNGATRAQRLASSENLWKWIDTHGKEFGVGRPYLDRDPPHVAPIDGTEYAAHHAGRKPRQSGTTAKRQTGSRRQAIAAR